MVKRDGVILENTAPSRAVTFSLRARERQFKFSKCSPPHVPS